jgi:exosome complex component CSL4
LIGLIFNKKMNTKQVLPGNKISEIKHESIEYLNGKGTYIRNNKIYSSIQGKVYVEQTETNPIIHVIPNKDKETIVPEIGSMVTCKVIKITPWYAKVNILCVDGRVLYSEVEGMIRSQDVRATEIDKVVIADSFRPGNHFSPSNVKVTL